LGGRFFEARGWPVQQIAIQLVAHRGDVAALLGSQDVAGAAQFQIAHRNAKPGAHVAELFNGPQSLAAVVERCRSGLTSK